MNKKILLMKIFFILWEENRNFKINDEAEIKLFRG